MVVPASLHHGQALARDSEQDLRQVVQEGPDGIPKLASKIGASTLSQRSARITGITQMLSDAVRCCQMLSLFAGYFRSWASKARRNCDCSVLRSLKSLRSLRSLSQRHDWNTCCHKSHGLWGCSFLQSTTYIKHIILRAI